MSFFKCLCIIIFYLHIYLKLRYFKKNALFLLALKRHKNGNGKPLQQWELLAHYKDFIETQLRCYCFQDAMNTFKKIKYFKLDSMNPKDVEDYMRSFNSSFDEDQDDINLVYTTLQTVAILCEQKCRALHGLGKSDTLRKRLDLSHFCLDFSKKHNKIWNIAKFRKNQDKSDRVPSLFYVQVFRWTGLKSTIISHFR